MSNRLVGQVFQLSLNSSLKLVFMALADAADDDGGSCYPKVATLARKASISERQAQRNLKTLRSDDWCSVVGNERGGRHTCRYRINVYKLKKEAQAAKDALRGDNWTPHKKTTGGPHLGHRTGGTGDTTPVPSMSPELSVELSIKKTTTGDADNLIWPSKLSEEQVVVAKEIISKLDPSEQQKRLDELSGAMDNPKGPRDPISWLRQIVVGRFVPLLCLKVAADRDRHARNAAEEEVAKVAVAEAKRLTSEHQARVDSMDESKVREMFAGNPDLAISSQMIEAWLRDGRPSMGHVAAAARIAVSRRDEAPHLLADKDWA